MCGNKACPRIEFSLKELKNSDHVSSLYFQAEEKLQKKRLERAAARETRLKELERQQKEVYGQIFQEKL